jgi:hypothetical protein
MRKHNFLKINYFLISEVRVMGRGTALILRL